MYFLSDRPIGDIGVRRRYADENESIHQRSGLQTVRNLRIRTIKMDEIGVSSGMKKGTYITMEIFPSFRAHRPTYWSRPQVVATEEDLVDAFLVRIAEAVRNGVAYHLRPDYGILPVLDLLQQSLELGHPQIVIM